MVGWFNATNNTSFNPEPKEIVFGLLKQRLTGHGAVRKFHYTFLYMIYYIYSNKLKESLIMLSDFVNKINFKYMVEKFTCLNLFYSPFLIVCSLPVHVSM